MSTRLQALVHKATARQNELNRLLEGGNDLTLEESRRAGELSAEIKSIKASFQSLAEAEQASSELKAMMTQTPDRFNFGSGATPDDEVEIDRATGAGKGIKGFTREQLGIISTKGYRDAFFGEYLGKGLHGMSHTARKALNEGADAGGGYLVPEEVQRRLVEKRPTPTRLAGMVSRFTTGRDNLTFPSVNWTSDDLYANPIRLTKTGELPASSSTSQQTDPSFGLVRIQVYTHMVNGQITKDFLEDGLFDMQSWLVDKYGEAADLLRDYKILMGTGIGDVTGMLANPGGTVGGRQQPAAVALGNPISGDGLLDIAFRVPEQYDDGCWYIFNKTNSLRTYVKLKDATNRYLFSGRDYGDTGIATARPKELAGYPYALSGFMPDTVDANGSAIANAYPVIFGDPLGYYYVERVGLSVQVLDQTRAKENQIELVGRLRFGGETVEDWRLKIGKQA